jgi:hypothetical protein
MVHNLARRATIQQEFRAAGELGSEVTNGD